MVQFIACVSGLMIIFTVLLICYNPRDDIEVELLKTGIMTEQEMQSIREFRASNKLSFSKGRPSIVWDGNNMVFDVSSKKISKRKRKSGKVSPQPEEKVL